MYAQVGLMQPMSSYCIQQVDNTNNASDNAVMLLTTLQVSYLVPNFPVPSTANQVVLAMQVRTWQLATIKNGTGQKRIIQCQGMLFPPSERIVKALASRFCISLIGVVGEAEQRR